MLVVGCPPARAETESTHQFIGGGIQVSAHLGLVQVARYVAELHPDLRTLAVKRLARLQQEGHAVPPRVVDEHRHRAERWAQAAMQASTRRLENFAPLLNDMLWVNHPVADEHRYRAEVGAQAAAHATVSIRHYGVARKLRFSGYVRPSQGCNYRTRLITTP